MNIYSDTSHLAEAFFYNFKNKFHFIGDFFGRSIRALPNIPQLMKDNHNAAIAIIVTINTIAFSVINLIANCINSRIEKHPLPLTFTDRIIKFFLLEGVLVGGSVFIFNYIFSKATNYPLSRTTITVITAAAIALRIFAVSVNDAKGAKKAEEPKKQQESEQAQKQQEENQKQQKAEEPLHQQEPPIKLQEIEKQQKAEEVQKGPEEENEKLEAKSPQKLDELEPVQKAKQEVLNNQNGIKAMFAQLKKRSEEPARFRWPQNGTRERKWIDDIRLASSNKKVQNRCLPRKQQLEALEEAFQEINQKQQ
jgi:hypothetical protein